MIPLCLRHTPRKPCLDAICAQLLHSGRDWFTSDIVSRPRHHPRSDIDPRSSLLRRDFIGDIVNDRQWRFHSPPRRVSSSCVIEFWGENIDFDYFGIQTCCIVYCCRLSMVELFPSDFCVYRSVQCSGVTLISYSLRSNTMVTLHDKWTGTLGGCYDWNWSVTSNFNPATVQTVSIRNPSSVCVIY